MNTVLAHINFDAPNIADSNADHTANDTEFDRLLEIARTYPDLVGGGYVSLDVPRTAEASSLIASLADSYAVANEDGEIVGTFPTLAQAEAARA